MHLHLKSAFKAHETSRWNDIIPIILLGMRSAVNNDIQAACAELAYGTTLRLPFDLFSFDKISICNPTYLTMLRDKMRVDSVQPPLSQPYTGPHLALRRSDKVFTNLVNGKKKSVPMDQVKPAFCLDDDSDVPSVSQVPKPEQEKMEITSHPNKQICKTFPQTKSG
ncbi:hypothetical protein HNY73_023178 [Argiope bruennichi]|uniref:Uncharacterized protein n=1 Tax=Argiope bruennichi TaxID=94029 RepID=A0A8T0E6Z2_ARGBR|nr:hypothetical protein HNY73_023178 [Argiope bruennichi]